MTGNTAMSADGDARLPEPGSAFRRLLRAGRRFGGTMLRSMERALHPLRRRRARTLVQRAAPVDSILVICTGNICRSPYAAEALRRRLARNGSGIDISCAGFVGPGRPSPPAALAVAARRGIDLASHRSRLIHLDRMLNAGLIVVMERRHRSSCAHLFGRSRGVLLLGDLDPSSRPPAREILDPFEREEEVFDEVYARIDACVNELARLLEGAARARHDRQDDS